MEVVVGIRRLNHAVLYVRDVGKSVAFYRDVLGFRVVHERATAAFLRAADSDNDHDLGLFAVRGSAPRTDGTAIGLYHLAWSVNNLTELGAFWKLLGQA